MLDREYKSQNCSVARALEIVGERWTLLIVRDAILGLRRFDQFQESLGIARNVLAHRLNRLVDEGILDRVLYCPKPERYEYLLTPMGRDLIVPIAGLQQWADKYIAEVPSRLLRGGSDRQPVLAALVPKGTEVLSSDQVELVPGPGFRAD